MLTQTSKPLIEWPDPFVELLGFIVSFLASGAIGFRFAVLGRRVRSMLAGDENESVIDRAALRAAAVGAAGGVGMLLTMLNNLPQAAARQHLTVQRLLATNLVSALQLVAASLAVIGFVLALAKIRSGWAIAAAGVIGLPLVPFASGNWTRAVNPIHETVAGLWIGTLFVMLFAGLGTVRKSGISAQRRGLISAEMVHSFSPLALSAAGVLALSGVITAWRHLKHLSALWTTPYGYALIVKLTLVLVVLALGAWNWRRQRPILGSEAAADALRKSATAELIAAGAVLMVTAILVSLPSPR